jgi:hypothetical protein
MGSPNTAHVGVNSTNGYTDSVNFNFNPDDPTGSSVSLQNPGHVDLHQTNPELASQIDMMKGYQKSSQPMLEQYFDPTRLAGRRDDMIQRQNTTLQNQYARMGLSGSSAAAGALGEADRQIDFGFQDRQLRELQSALGIEQGLSSGIVHDTMAGQSQYSSYQSQILQTLLAMRGQDAQAQQANGQMIGSGIGALGTIAGAAVAGPVGAGVGGALGGMAKSGMGGRYGGTADPSMLPDYSSMISEPEMGSQFSGPGYSLGYFGR